MSLVWLESLHIFWLLEVDDDGGGGKKDRTSSILRYGFDNDTGKIPKEILCFAGKCTMHATPPIQRLIQFSSHSFSKVKSW
jgi:hypothetical protein